MLGELRNRLFCFVTGDLAFAFAAVGIAAACRIAAVRLFRKEAGGRRTIFVGDVHGCFDELMMLLEKCSYDLSKDRLVFVGDVINKGPKSKEVLQWIMNHPGTDWQAMSSAAVRIDRAPLPSRCLVPSTQETPTPSDLNFRVKTSDRPSVFCVLGNHELKILELSAKLRGQEKMEKEDEQTVTGQDNDLNHRFLPSSCALFSVFSSRLFFFIPRLLLPDSFSPSLVFSRLFPPLFASSRSSPCCIFYFFFFASLLDFLFLYTSPGQKWPKTCRKSRQNHADALEKR